MLCAPGLVFEKGRGGILFRPLLVKGGTVDARTTVVMFLYLPVGVLVLNVCDELFVALVAFEAFGMIVIAVHCGNGPRREGLFANETGFLEALVAEVLPSPLLPLQIGLHQRFDSARRHLA